ncbi:hypothetical protein METBIDRAFT_40918 [Metschnikowia bicuspidata var. bicuspidata NRRL YB-4993]|uniref:Uncharacterized protein n=1 Tax=Metschnikowia bicuspidata var. bicuspidata NRRL YB-4993 TaxID=869754 RepID=A0A1A0HBJ9_9ASCO|nr:hypothetical protein METBIDRAFT_40918 [Metschnikowia bicuspidata var. bicuspidata NRRL YB-4993]OBA21252.1 hypothetical protein METBIDRAFT_40918 [Metschnikowia bicuspidata var. bicuspidata NRRL YB-4993]
MSKRAVGANQNEPKKAKVLRALYTQGPLDEVFGQHRAFPLDAPSEEDSLVFEYLASVRKEAEHDQVCHFVSEEPGYSEEPYPAEDEVKDTPDLEASESPSLTEREAGTTESCSTEPKEKFVECGLQTLPDDPSNASYPVPASAASWRQLVFTTPVPSQEFFQNVLEHPTIIKLIVYYTKWLLGSLPESLSDWIFATFVRLDCDMDYQEMAIVRALGVKALKLRQKLFQGATEGAQISHTAQLCVDMVLAVISQYYGQKDLVRKR